MQMKPHKNYESVLPYQDGRSGTFPSTRKDKDNRDSHAQLREQWEFSWLLWKAMLTFSRILGMDTTYAQGFYKFPLCTLECLKILILNQGVMVDTGELRVQGYMRPFLNKQKNEIK